MKINRKFLIITMIILLFTSLMLQGCRPSTAIRVPNNEKNNQQKLAGSDQLSQSTKGEESKDVSPNKEGTSDRKDEDKKSDTKKDIVEVAKYEYSQDGQDTKDDSNGGNGAADNENGTNNGEGNATADNKNDTDNNKGTAGNGTGNAEAQSPVALAPEKTRQVYDGNGTFIEIPENIERVSAVGQATASAVHMLGGTGRLVAVSQDYTNSSIASSIFNDFGNIQTLWSGSGTAGISEDNFNKLIALKPQVCFYISGSNSFSDAQLNALKAQKIQPIVLPNPNIPDRLKQLVTIVGKVMGNRNGIDGEKLARQYNDYFTNTMGAVSNKVQPASSKNFNSDSPWSESITGSINPSPYATAFIDDWDANADCKWYSKSGSNYIAGTGAAVIQTGSSSSPLNYYMNMSGISNYGISKSTSEQTYRTGYSYFSPIYSADNKYTVNGKYGSNNYNMSLWIGNFTWTTISNVENKFTALIVNSKAVKEKITSEKSRDKSVWKEYDAYDGTDSQGNWGFKDGKEIYLNRIGGTYDIYVNPKGLVSWTEGTPESILEPIWLASKFYSNSFSENDVKAKVKEFYKTFYRYDLSDSMINKIIGGAEN